MNWATHPFINEAPNYGLPHHLYKKFSTPPPPHHYPNFLDTLIASFVNRGVSNYEFAPLQETKYLNLEGFLDIKCDGTGKSNTNIWRIGESSGFCTFDFTAHIYNNKQTNK